MDFEQVTNLTTTSTMMDEHWVTDVEWEEAMSNMDMEQVNINKDQETVEDCDTLKRNEIDGLVTSWVPTTPESNIHQVDMSRPATRNMKRKRVKNHKSSRVREIKIEDLVVTEFKVPNYDTKLSRNHENDIEMNGIGPEVYENNVKFTHTQTEVMYDESICQLQQLCIENQSMTHKRQNMTHKFDDDLSAAVSQLFSLKIRDSLNIFDEYQNMEVLKQFQNLKIWRSQSHYYIKKLF